MIAKAEALKETLKASTWHELETQGKFDKNKKLTFIDDDMLILGCDVGSETHYLRAIDTRGRELSKSAFSFSNSLEGFQSAKDWAVKLAAENDKNQIVLGLEPTGHYWFCLTTWMVSNGISVVQVNPYAVNEDRIRFLNRLYREMKIYFPEYKDAFGKFDGAFSLDVQVSSKKSWLEQRFDEGLVFVKSNERGKCFIEYIPAEYAWNPIDAEGYMYIDCLWVAGSFKGHGYASELLNYSIEDSKQKGKKGLCILSCAKKKPFLSDPKFLKYKGFEPCKTEGRFFCHEECFLSRPLGHSSWQKERP